MFQKGDEVEAVVLGIDVDNERISLGVKQLAEDPWQSMHAALSGRQPRARQGHQRHRLRRLRRDRGRHRGPHPRLAAQHRAGRQAAEHVQAPGQEIEAEVTAIDARDRKIALSIKALRKSEEREEIESYLQREREGGRFSFEDILSADLRLDRDEPGRRAVKRENDETEVRRRP